MASPTLVPRTPRRELSDARDDRLFFAQVREDPELELAAFADCLDGTLAVVSSGGCTALSLVAAGARRVVAVDLNRTQNHIVELKAAAVAAAARKAAAGEDAAPQQLLAFLGGTAAADGDRLGQYQDYRNALSDDAARFWDGRPRAVGSGVLNAGVSERLIGGIAWVVRRAAHPRRHVERFLSCTTLEEQRSFYRQEWDSARWRALIHLMANRMVLRRAYDPAFFQHVDNPSFARHFLGTIENSLTSSPIRDNYFFHHMFTGYYQTSLGGGTPPYLAGHNVPAMADLPERLLLVDGSLIAYLRDCPDGSLAGFSLSNICEWLSPSEIDELFGHIVRTARPGARLCFRNFLGWNEVPERWRDRVHEDRALGDKLITQDRSMLQRRIALCTIVG